MPSSRPPDRRHLLLIPLAALVAVLPLIVHGCSCGHDFDFHLLNWIEAATQFAHGNLHPHWAYTPAYNAGEPRFVFYPPISWTLGALLGLLLTHLPGVSEAAGWSAAPILYTWIALTLSGLTLHRLARAFATPNAALLAAVLYLANPYMLFTAYERTAYAELLAAAWLPLLLFAILRTRVTIAGIALPLALLWLTNAPAAVIGTYSLALLAALRLAAAYRATPNLGSWSVRWREEPTLSGGAGKDGPPGLVAGTILAGTTLGLALPAFYLLPAAYERRYVQIAMATIAGMRIDQNFLFEHTGTSSDALLHDQVLHTASLIAVLLLIATALALATVLPRRRPRTGLARAFPLVPLTILTATIAFLLTPWSAFVWSHAPQASFLQFPWRLLSVLAAILALAFARAITLAQSPGGPSFAALSRRVGYSRHARTVLFTLATLTFAAALAFPAYHVFRQRCFSEDTAPTRVALFHSNAGTDPTDEYTPLHADNDALNPADPPYWLAPDANDSAFAVGPILQVKEAASSPPQPGPAPAHFSLTAPRPEYLILNLRDYPAWRITLNGAPAPQRLHRPDGLIALPIPAGASTLAIAYANTPDQTLGDAITLLALPLLLLTLRSRRPR